MTDQTQPRDQGKYSFKQQSEAGVALAAPAQAAPLSFQGQASLDPSVYADLPELPARVGTPEVTFDFSDEGKLETHVTLGDTTLSFWKDDMDGETTNSIESGNSDVDVAPWSHIQDMEDFQQARTWGEAVHERIEGATSQILESAVQADSARHSIVAFATGQSADEPEDLTPEQASAERSEHALSSYDSGEDDATRLQDLFTDLRHFADRRGIDLHEALDASYGNYFAEKNDPDFKEGL